MVNHIYGKTNLQLEAKRPHVFINELKLYIEYLKKDMENNIAEITSKKEKYLNNFFQQLHNGIAYYKDLMNQVLNKETQLKASFYNDLQALETKLNELFTASAIPS